MTAPKFLHFYSSVKHFADLKVVVQNSVDELNHHYLAKFCSF